MIDPREQLPTENELAVVPVGTMDAEAITAIDSERSLFDRTRERLQGVSAQLGNLAALTAVGFELNHVTNEGSRAYVLATVQGATHSTPLATAACVAATAAIEGAGAFGAAHLLDTKYARRFIDRTGIGAKATANAEKPITGKTKVQRAVIDSALAISLGSPATVASQHLRNPARTRAENVRSGLAVSAAVSVATAPVEWFLASPAGEAVNRIGEGNAAAATAGLVGFMGLVSYIKNRRSNRS